MKNSYSIKLFLIAYIFVLSSCLKDTVNDISNIKGVKASPSFSAPLIDASLGMKEIYESYSQSAIIKENPDKLIVFVYQSQDTVQPVQFFDFPSIPFNFDLQMTPPVIALFEANGEFNIPVSDSIKLPQINNEQIKSINVKNGRFSFNIVNEYRHDIFITISYPTITKNGLPISEIISLPYDANNYPRTFTKDISLRNYDIDFTDGGKTVNTIPFTYSIDVTRIPSNPTLPSEKLSLNQTFELDGYNSIKGYLGKFEILKSSEEQNIDIFNNSDDGQFFINDPRLTIKVFNTYGIPVTGRITNLRIVTQNNENISVNINPFQDTFSFASPTQLGELAVSEFKISKLNSNIDVAINSRPKYLKFNMAFVANYNDEVVDNFLVDTAKFAVDFNSEIPFDIKIIDYVAKAKQNNNSFGPLGNNILDIRLDVKTENTLPFDVNTQMVFSRDSVTLNGDTIDIAIDSLFATEIAIKGGFVDGNGIVLMPSTNIQSVFLPLDRYAKIAAAPKNIVRIRSNSSQFEGVPGFVKVYTYQKLNIKIGGDVKLTFKSN